VIVAGVLMLLVIAPLAVFWADGRMVVAGLACCLAAVALWRAATLQARVRAALARPSSAADVIHMLSGWLARRRRDPIVSQSALGRGREYAAGIQDGAYATLDEMMDRLAELLRMLPEEQHRIPGTPQARGDRPEGGDPPAHLPSVPSQPGPDQPTGVQPRPAARRRWLRSRPRRKPALPGAPPDPAEPAGWPIPDRPAGPAGPTSQAAQSVPRPVPPAARRPPDAETLPARTF
jgi:hypothetical protein